MKYYAQKNTKIFQMSKFFAIYIKGEILAITKAYQYKQIAQEIGRLHM